MMETAEGKTTYLVADQDDDGDGVLDILEGETTTESGDFSTSTLLLIVLILGGLILFVMRMKQGGGELGSIDERHL